MAELEASMRAQTRMVREGVALADIFESCRDDCSGHRAGYLWAIDNNLVTEADCDAAATQSFREGCHRGVRAAAFE